MAICISLPELKPPSANGFICAFIVSNGVTPKRCKSGQYMLSFTVADETNWNERFEAVHGKLLVVNVFRRLLDELPTAVQDRSVICFKDLRIQRFGQKLQGVCYKDMAFALFNIESPSNAPYWVGGFPEDYASYPLDRILALQRWFHQQTRISDSELPVQPVTAQTRPLYKAEDITRTNEFFDFIGEVLQVNIEDIKATLILTDYTTFKLQRERQSFIQCDLWDNHVQECKSITQGMIIRIDNLRIKESVRGNYKAVLHGDNFSKKIQILHDNSDECRQLVKRREEQSWSAILEGTDFYFPRKDSTEILVLPTDIAEIKAAEFTPTKFRCLARIVDIYHEEASCTVSKTKLCTGLLISDGNSAIPAICDIDDLKSFASDFESLAARREFLRLIDGNFYEIDLVSFPIFEKDGNRIIMYKILKIRDSPTS